MLDFLFHFFNQTKSIELPVEEPPALIQEVEPAKVLPCSKCVYITNSEDSLENSYNTNNNYLYEVNVILNNKVEAQYYTLSGRAWTQNHDRNTPDTHAPSPNGKYIIQDITTGIHMETGGVFIPYEPTFETKRSSLGFHIDPSWGLKNGEDGTKGCHAFKTREEFTDFFTLINDNSITKLIIDYERR